MRRALDHGVLNWRTWCGLAWLGVAALAGGMIISAIAGAWWGVVGMLNFLVLSVGFLLLTRRLPHLVHFLVVLAAFLNAYGWVYNWFDALVFYDELVHAYTTGALALAAALWLWQDRRYPSEFGRFVAATAGLGLGIGILWELAEMAFLDLRLIDTISDLVMDTAGAALAGLFGAWAVHSRPLAVRSRA